MNQLIEYANEVILDYPDLTQEITELVQLCYDAILDGESPENEINICLHGIKEFVES